MAATANGNILLGNFPIAYQIYFHRPLDRASLPQPSRRHDSELGDLRNGDAEANDHRPVEGSQDAGPVHREGGGGPGCGGQVLPGEILRFGEYTVTR